MGATTTPDDVDLPGFLLGTVPKGRAAVDRPSHLKDAWRPPYRFHSQTLAESAAAEVAYEFLDRREECLLLIPAQSPEVTQESRERLMGWHLRLAPGLQVSDQLPAALVTAPSSGRKFC